MYFIDRLDVYQDHLNGGLPIVGKELISIYDIDSGELVRQSPNPKPLKGSYCTSIRVRCDGYRVSIEGNPSRWNRIDNLFGFNTFEQCIQIYNYELLKLGLPPFTKCTRVSYLQSSEDKRAKRITDGALFRRVDWTQNLSVGKNNVSKFLNALSSQRTGKGILPLLYSDGNTLMWSTTLWSLKCYNKAEEMKLPRNKKLIKTLSKCETELREKIISYCEEIGLVRIEKQFNRDLLHKDNICYYGLTNENEFKKYLNDIETIIDKIEISTMDYEHISDQLILNKICNSRQSANATQSYVFAWLYGQKNVKISQYYIHKSRLLKLGIDISLPYDSTKPLPQLKREREIIVSIASPPEWYEMPTTNRLRVAS